MSGALTVMTKRDKQDHEYVKERFRIESWTQFESL